jgi:hypothetical protein
MAQYGRIQRTFQDSQGRPIVGLNITIRKQGATVNGLHSGAQTSFTVNDPGGITSSPADQLQVGTNTAVTRAVSSVAATNITVGATGFTDVADDARLTPTTNLPAVYNDAQGGEAITQPLSTDANGSIECWAPVVPYDLYTPGNVNYAARLIQDVVPEGQEYVVSNIFPSATSVAFQKDTLRAQVSGSKLERWMSAQVEKFYIDLNASLEPRLPAHHVGGLLTIDSGGIAVTSGGIAITAGGLTVASGTSAVQAVTATSGAFSTTLGVTGTTTLRADLSSGSPTSLDLQDDTPTTFLRLAADSGGSCLIDVLTRQLLIRSSLAQGSKSAGAIQLRNTTDLNASDMAMTVFIGSAQVFGIGNTNYRLYINGDGSSHGEVMAGFGTPEGAVTAPVGSLYLRANGGANTTLYIKESGTGNTGWIPK